MRVYSVRLAVRLAVNAAAITIAVLTAPTPAVSQAKQIYTPDELVVLNGIGGFGDVGRIETSRTLIAPGNANGFSLRFTWQNHGQPGYWSIRQPMPVGIDLALYDTFSCDLYVVSNEGAALKLFLYEPSDNRNVIWDHSLNDAGVGRWIHIQVKRSEMRPWLLSATKPGWDNIIGLSIEPFGEKAVFYLDNLRLLGPGGRTAEIVTTGDDGFHAPASWNEPVEKLPAAGTIYYPYDSAHMADDALRGSPEQFANLLGQVGTPLSGYTPNLVSVSRELRSAGIPTIYYSSFGSGYTRYFTRRRAWDSNALGHTLNSTPGNLTGWDYQHTFAMAHPAVFEAEKQRIDALLHAGIGTWMVVDYTFPWMETLWGYSDAMVSAYRQDLAGTDEGLHIRQPGKDSILKFADYFRAYNGFVPAPADTGLPAWNQFTPYHPGDEGPFRDARQTLFMQLRSYEWLKLPDRVGRYYAKKGGNPLWIIPNPEDTNGSSDYVFMLRSAGVGNLFPEYFGCLGWAAEAGYASLPYLREQADRSGSRLSIIQETGAGGHSAPYLDWRLSYAGIYALTAVGRFDDIDNDFMDESPYSEMRDPIKNAYQFTRFRDGVSKGMAFRQVKAEKPQRPTAQILCVSERPPAKSVGSIFFTLNQPHSLAAGLSRAHLVFDLRDSLDLDRVLDRYRILVYAPRAPRVGDLALIRRWLLAKPGRTLITHSFVPTRDTRDYRGLNNGAELGSVNGGAMLGVGRISAGTAVKCNVTSVSTWLLGVFVHRLELASPLTHCEFGQPLVKTDAGTLVTMAQIGGSRVIYLHYTPGDSTDTQRFDAALLRDIAVAEGIAPTCETDFDAPVEVFDVKGGKSVIAWDASAMGRWTFKYEPGIAPLGFDAPGVSREIRLPAKGTSKWLVYDFWTDRLETVVPVDGKVILRMKDVITSLYYVGPDTAEFRATLDTAKRTREKMRSLHF